MTEGDVAPDGSRSVARTAFIHRHIGWFFSGAYGGVRRVLALFLNIRRKEYSGWLGLVSVCTPQWLGWVTKNGRTCGKIGVNVQLVRSARTAQAFGTDLAHGSSARYVAHSPGESCDENPAGCSADRMSRLERATVPR